MFPNLADPGAPVPVATFRAAIPAMANPQRYPDATCELYLGMAHENMNAVRYGDMFAIAQCWYAAHYLTLLVPVMGPGGSSGGGAGAGALVASKSVGGASISYDNSATIEEGAGFWNSTIYGRMLWKQMQLAGMGPLQFN